VRRSASQSGPMHEDWIPLLTATCNSRSLQSHPAPHVCSARRRAAPAAGHSAAQCRNHITLHHSYPAYSPPVALHQLHIVEGALMQLPPVCRRQRPRQLHRLGRNAQLLGQAPHRALAAGQGCRGPAGFGAGEADPWLLVSCSGGAPCVMHVGGKMCVHCRCQHTHDKPRAACFHPLHPPAGRSPPAAGAPPPIGPAGWGRSSCAASGAAPAARRRGGTPTRTRRGAAGLQHGRVLGAA